MIRRTLALACTTLVLLACAGEEERVELYDRAPVPAVPDRTTAIADRLVDGPYWAEATRVEQGAAPAITFRLTQALFGPACIDELGADGCSDDFGVVPAPAAELTVALDDLQSISVVSGARQNYAVTATELAALVAGGEPAEAAPDDYAYTPYPFLLTVQDGTAVVARQIWVP